MRIRRGGKKFLFKIFFRCGETDWRLSLLIVSDSKHFISREDRHEHEQYIDKGGIGINAKNPNAFSSGN
ncbi:MAG TPA: hypothetical protein DCS28_00990 [Candidatus Moranbacteria bacterium]|nr:hypothetical protein [Candidatus Moranbacteria bacterium]HAT74604.1 hypothetical protein [Candidatus Moranbacteria bacterium]